MMLADLADPAAEAFFRATRLFESPTKPVPVLADLQTAYAVQNKIFRSNTSPTIWKLGGVNHVTRAAFNVESTYAGPVANNQIFPFHETMLPSCFGMQCQAELELLVRLNDNFQNTSATSFDVAPALECPATVLNFPEDGVLALIADCCAAGTVVHGPWRNCFLDDLCALEGAATLSDDTRVLAQGTYSELIDGLAGCVAGFLALAREYNLPVRAGDMVSTGGLSPCVGLPHQTRLSVAFPGFDTINFEISRASDA